MATEGKQPNFQAFFDNSWALCASLVRDVSWTWHFYAVSRTWCAGNVQDATGRQPDFHDILGNVQDASGPWKGCSLVSRPCSGRILTAVGTNPNFQAFVGSLWARCAGHVRDAARFLGICKLFVGTMCRPYPGHVLVAVGTQPNFQAMFSVFRQCSGLFEAAVGLQLDFQVLLGEQFLGHGVQAMSWMRQGGSQNFRQFLGHNVQAMTRTRPAHDRDATYFLGNSGKFLGTVYRARSGRVLAVLLEHGVHIVSGMRLGHGRDAAWFPGIFRQFLGHGVWAMSRPRPGRVLATVGMQPNFQAFVGSLWAQCVGHVWDASRSWLGHRLIFRHFFAIFGTMCAGHVWDASWPRQGQSLFSCNSGQFHGHGVQAMSRMRQGRI
ncbi:Hypothetical predicted protein [Olea europaea subsp. europaea]|uniref:Uncharacterized protein n=1 Tax=Olea europaea subsp. europaea TaxID=158383 RepID=A0A8S0THK6_OLEEU|nr:Hypothetical predicted protein [Olea europaea subsp. europaea]